MTFQKTIKTTDTTVPPRASKREWLGLAILALPCLLYSMDLTVLHMAVPQITEALNPSGFQLLWIVDIYGFILAGMLITMGALGDRIGRRKLLLIGALVFGLASVLAAFASNVAILLIARILLGAAAATLAPSTLSLIRNMFLNPKQRSFAVGVWVASFSVGAAIGPLVGGFLLNYFWWGSVFLMALPAMVLLLAVGPKILPEYRDPKPGRLDLLSAGLSMLAILAFVFGVKQIAEHGFSEVAGGALLASLVALTIFIRRQRRLSDPFLDLTLFRSPLFSSMIGLYVLVIFVSFAAFLFIAQYLQLVLGMSPLTAGLWTLPWAASFIVGSVAATALTRIIRPPWLMAGGLVVATIGYVVLTQVDSWGGPGLVAGSIIFPLGLAPVIALITDTIISSVPPQRAGVASGLSEAGSELGGALGIALIGSAAAAVYRHDMQTALPKEVPEASGGPALETLSAALQVASQLPPVIAERLKDIAIAAFTHSVVVAFALCAAVALSGAVIAALAASYKNRKDRRFASSDK